MLFYQAAVRVQSESLFDMTSRAYFHFPLTTALPTLPLSLPTPTVYSLTPSYSLPTHSLLAHCYSLLDTMCSEFLLQKPGNLLFSFKPSCS